MVGHQTICELSTFEASARGVLGADEVESLIDFLALRPTAGDLIPGTGGLRKLRWRRSGIGRRGGARVIYYFFGANVPLYLILAYAKSARDDLSPDQLRRVRRIVGDIVAQWREGRRR